LTAVLAAACAPALVEPPSLVEMAGVREAPPSEEADALLQAADRQFATRELEAVREAARIYLEAAAADPARLEAEIGAVNALVWLADHEPKGAVREAVATQAVHAAQWCGRHHPGEPACDYWLGAGLGVQARERSTTGLSAMSKVEAAFQRAAEGDPEMDHAGPYRALALFYLRAPGWPRGPGDEEMGLKKAEEAVALAPGHAPNLFTLAEALKSNGRREESREAYRSGLKLAGEAAANGDPEAAEWIEEAARRLGPPPESGS
jgi:tetratricopeptide (TPR) repeat protein